MNAPVNNVHEQLARALKVQALVEAIDHVCNAQRADNEARVRFVEGLTEERWETLTKLASTARGKNFGNPSKEARTQVLLAFRARVSTVDCPECGGQCGVVHDGWDEGGYHAEFEPCDLCEGQGTTTPAKAAAYGRHRAAEKARREAEQAARIAAIPNDDIAF